MSSQHERHARILFPRRVTEAVPQPPAAITVAASLKGDPGALAAMPVGTRRASSGGKGALAPSSFYCPISMELMGDPCMLATGHTYERVRPGGFCFCAPKHHAAACGQHAAAGLAKA